MTKLLFTSCVSILLFLAYFTSTGFGGMKSIKYILTLSHIYSPIHSDISLAPSRAVVVLWVAVGKHWIHMYWAVSFCHDPIGHGWHFSEVLLKNVPAVHCTGIKEKAKPNDFIHQTRILENHFFFRTSVKSSEHLYQLHYSWQDFWLHVNFTS